MKSAIHIAEEVRHAVAALNIQHADSDVAEHVSLSLGVATISADQTMSPLELIEAADASLYQAKENGRNRTFHFSELPKIEQGGIMTTIKIKGMSCNHCVMAVTKALNEIKGIKNVKVDLAKGEAYFDEVKPIDMNIARKAIRKAGYEDV